MQTSGRKGWGKCGSCLAVTGGIVMVGVVFVGMAGAVAAPIAIAFCY